MKRRALSRGGLPSKAGRLALALACAAFGYAAYVYLTLPDVAPLQAANPKTTAFMELRDREAHDQGRPSRREQRWVSYARISPALKRAVLVAEDAAFWRHEPRYPAELVPNAGNPSSSSKKRAVFSRSPTL